jgi:16S rRNA (uracil1498-N3)-methyltransferase
METHEFKFQRLFVEAPLHEGAVIAATATQSNYLLNVLRLGEGDEVLLFNGRDGEWRAALARAGKRAVTLDARERIRLQTRGPDLDYLFAPLKHARLDYMVQKAAEMGVARLRPVLTRRTIALRVNLERMRLNAIEAAEQCGILHVPEVVLPAKLEVVLADWDPQRLIVFCDEGAAVANPVDALGQRAGPRGGNETRPLALLVGPEGGFDPGERETILEKSCVLAISLGPRTLRADTAAVAALALVNATLGDWR